MNASIFCFRYTALQVIDLIQTADEEELDEAVDPDAKYVDVALGMPDENEQTDEDSDKEDQPENDPSCLGRGVLQSTAFVSGLNLEPRLPEDVPKKKKKNVNLEWKKSDTMKPTFVSPSPSLSLSEEAEKEIALCSNPIDFFFLLFDEDLQNYTVSESNLYAQSKGVSLNLTIQEFQNVIGILFLSGYNKVPSIRLFWSNTNDTRNELVASTMSRNRFLEIIRHIHCAHDYDASDKLWKLRPFIQKLLANFKKFVRMNVNVCVDESMIKYYGHHPMKQFIRGKPIRYGYKVWMLCSSTGQCHHFKMYTGADEDKDPNHLVGESVVLKMSEFVPPGCQLYMDRYFTSLNLLKMLAEKLISAAGTIQQNRLRGAQDTLTSESSFKKIERGSSESVTSNDVVVTQWRDNKTVLMASNFIGKEPEGKCSRFSRSEKKNIQIKQPKVIQLYNKHMGGVDVLDQSINSYRIAFRIRKWYWSIFSWLLDLACVNSWHVAKLDGPSDVFPQLLQFRRDIVLSLLSKDVRYQRTSLKRQSMHTIIRAYDGSRRRCKTCKSHTVYRCSACDVPLHANSCFDAFHS